MSTSLTEMALHWNINKYIQLETRNVKKNKRKHVIIHVCDPGSNAYRMLY